MNDKSILVSVIVPIYKVEKYLPKCIDSILTQSYKNFELLLIDDGSPDSCGHICDEYQEKDSRIRVFHKQNGGLSDARNYGIVRSKGDYLTFIDSDDYISNNYLKILVNMVQTYEVEMSCVACVIEKKGVKVPSVNKKNVTRKISKEEALKYVCIKKYFGVSAWGKLFKKELFRDIRFPVGRLYEDMLTIPYIIDKCKYVAYSEQQAYFWVQRDGSITHSPISEKELQIFDGLDRLMNFIDSNYPELHDAAICRYIDDSIWNIVHKLIYDEKYASKIVDVRKTCHNYWIKGMTNKFLSKGKKIQILLLLINVQLYKKIYIIVDKIRNN